MSGYDQLVEPYRRHPCLPQARTARIPACVRHVPQASLPASCT